MPRWGMVIDLDKCTACQACVAACQAENNVPFASETAHRRMRGISWMKIMHETEGEYPNVRTRFIPRPCMQCDNPPCTRVCPVYATYLNPEGIVAQVYARCIGCRFCMAGCPYTVKYFNWFDYRSELPQELARSTNPDVPTRPKGVVEKCTFCHHRLLKAKDQAAAERRPLREGDYVPACVESCPARDMRALAAFVVAGQIDMDLYIDRSAKKAKGDPVNGKRIYATICTRCHGADGKLINFHDEAKPEYLGTVAQGNPWETLHKVRMGQPGEGMPGMLAFPVQLSVDVVAYSQTLPAK